MNRIDRLTAILIHLQSKRVVKSEELADRFSISQRTVYRDVKALMEAGVPIGSEAGKGYFIVDGYHLPPVMFTQDEASAMMLAGKLVEKLTDKSVQTSFDSALHKIKAVLHESEKDHLESLQNLVQVLERPRNEEQPSGNFPDNFLTTIQRAVVKKQVLVIEYTNNKQELTSRELEPIGIFYYSSAWHLIAWCRLRNDYRDFRADRIRSLVNTEKPVENRNLLSLKEYMTSMGQMHEGLIKAVVCFDKGMLKGRQVYGSFSQEDQGDRIKIVFLIDNLIYIARMLLVYGSAATIEEPEELKHIMSELTEELFSHYGKVKELQPADS
ncbi:YafY family transcriptional regulator [Chryseotalea sanaruensis]|uniref:YafY family transcriptional regulator n=1 Tax=Chryseotalea sanaruensis TaxID=2482724 RepID=A0A401U943_9BACT|nr:YafY family protein [Chryseotalea sanaruensis]GCC51406.1 YafY family transcriptional regulator [Chryseotalea sanaruensis]